MELAPPPFIKPKRKKASQGVFVGNEGIGKEQFRRSPRARREKEQTRKTLSLNVIGLGGLIALFGLLYIQHGYQMEARLEQIQELERQQRILLRAVEEQRLIYDRLTGPKEVYQRAQTAGFIPSNPADERQLMDPRL